MRPLLRELGLLECFDVIVVSHEAGFTKPAQEIFQCAAKALNLPPETILHIGDSRSEDFDGARAAGMNSLLLDRRAGKTDGDVARSLAAVLEEEWNSSIVWSAD